MIGVRPLPATILSLLAIASMPAGVFAQGLPFLGNAGISASAAAIEGECAITKASFQATDRVVATSSHEDEGDGLFEAISFIPFKQGGERPGCVIVTFSSMSFAAGDDELGQSNLMQVKPVLDGDDDFGGGNSPDVVQLSGDDDEDGDGLAARSTTMTWAFANVAPGQHDIQITFRGLLDDHRVFSFKRTTVVYHQ